MANTSSWADTGFHDGNSVPQRAGAERDPIPEFEKSAGAFTVQSSVASPVVIANFGCAGVNALEPIAARADGRRAARLYL